MASTEVFEKYEKFYEKAKQHPKLWISIGLLLAVILLICLPPWRVSHFEINNATVEADLENQYRATLAQILGGSAVLVGIYFAWKNFELSQATLKHNQEASQKNLEVALETLESNMKNAQDNLKVAQEGQITERFTRAVDQLGACDKEGNPAIEIRLGGIYALERIANESEKDYWPIMEILTAYIREKSSIENKHQSYLNEDIQAILSVIRRRKHFLNNGENKGLDLHKTYLKEAYLEEANLEGANLEGAYLRQAQLKGADLRQARLKEAELIEAHLEEAHLEGVYLEKTYLGVPDMNPRVIHLERAHLEEAHLRGVNLFFANLEGAHLEGAHLEGTNFILAHLERSHLKRANLKGADLQGSCLEGADLEGADLEGAELENVDLRGAVNLTIEQLLKVKTLYKTKIDEKLLERLKTKTEYQKLSENPHLEKA